MNPVRTSMQTLASRIAYFVARYWGELMTYTHRGTDISVYVITDCKSKSSMRQTLGVRAQEVQRPFVIPRQTNFPPDDGPIGDDTITDENGDIFAVREWSDDSLSSCFEFTNAVFTKPKQAGAVGQ